MKALRTVVILVGIAAAIVLAVGFLMRLLLDPKVKVIQISGRRLLYEFRVPDVTEQIEFSPNGSILCSRDGYGNVYLWRTRDGCLLGRLRGGFHMAFSPDSRYLALAGDTVTLWRIPKVQFVRELPIKGYDGGHVSFSPDGKLLTITDGAIIYWGVPDGRQRKVLHSGSISTDMDFSRTGVFLFSQWNDQVTFFRSSDGGRVKCITAPPSKTEFPVDFSGDDSLLALGCSAIEVRRVWDQKLVFVQDRDREGMLFWPQAISLSGDGTTLAIAEHYTSSVWSIRKHKYLGNFGGGTSIALSPDGKLVALCAPSPIARQ